MELLGKIEKIYDKVSRSETFTLREFILHVPNPRDSRYDNHIRFQLNNDRTSLIDEFHEGDEVLVSFDLSGREWTSPEGDVRYIGSIVAWRIDRAGSGSAVNTSGAYSNKEVYGRLHKKMDIRQVTPTFSVHEFVVAVQQPSSQYEDFLLFQTVGRNVNLIDQYNEGDPIHVVFDIQGRKSVGRDGVERYFNSFNAYRIDRNQPQMQQPVAAQQQMSQPSVPPVTPTEQQIVGAAPAQSAASNPFVSNTGQDGNEDDLPF
jgi:single-stranded DNA-binding protein